MTLDKKWIKRIIIVIVSLFILYMSVTDLTFRPDEEFTMALIKHNIFDVIKLDSFDVHPPLYYLLLKLFLSITTFWTSSIFIKIVFARLFSSIAIIISFIFLIKLMNNLGIYKNNYIILLLFILFPSISFFATQIRMYALAGMFLTLEFYEIDKFDRFGNKKYLLLCILFTILAAYTHYFAAVSAGLFLLIFFVKYLIKRNKYKSISMLMSGLVLLVSYIPWIIYSLPKLRGNSNVNNYQIPINFKTILKQILGIPIKFTGISDSSMGSFNDIIVYPIIIIMLLTMISSLIYSFKYLSTVFNERLVEELLVFIFTAIICSLMKLLGFEYSAMFLYPIFIINNIFVISIVLYCLNKNKVFNILKIMSIFLIACCGVLSIYYGYVNYNQSVYAIDQIHVLVRKKSLIKIDNKNLGQTGVLFNHSQQLLENKDMFYTMNMSTYFLYYNKSVVINNTNNNQIFLMTNGKKIGHKVWNNSRIKTY